jgi:uncharacterized protein YndB with AHSA1/START domain
MPATRIVAETYIKATPDQIWSALTGPSFFERSFFATRFAGAVETGAEFTLTGIEGAPDVEGVVLTCEPPTRLAMTFGVNRGAGCRGAGQGSTVPPPNGGEDVEHTQ